MSLQADDGGSFLFFTAAQYRLQLASLNISVVYNATFPRGATDFEQIVQELGEAQPDIIAAAQQATDFLPMLKQLRKALPDKKQPKAITIGNSASVQVVYDLLAKDQPGDGGWQADTCFGGDQWSPFFTFTDQRFTDTKGFTSTYLNWVRSKSNSSANYTISFWDAASVQAGFVMQWAVCAHTHACARSAADVQMNAAI